MERWVIHRIPSFGTCLELGKIIEITDGHFNTVYCVKIPAWERRIILKVGTSEQDQLHSYERNSMETEVETYRLLSKNTKVPIPQLFKWDFSKQIINNNYMIISEMKGITWAKLKLQMIKSQNDDIFRELGKYCAQIHEIKGKYFGFFTDDAGQQYPSWRLAFLAMIKEILVDGKVRGISFQCPEEEIYNIFLQAASVLDDVKAPTLVGGDIWEGNIFIQPNESSYNIEGIIDFEKALWGDPYMDFLPAVAFLNNIKKQKSFLEGYCLERDYDIKITERAIVRINMYRAYLCLRIIIESYRYDEKYKNARIKAYLIHLKKNLKKISDGYEK